MSQLGDSNPKGKIIVSVDPDLEELIPEFLEMRQEDIQSMLGSLEKGDYKNIELLGHSMKGSGGGYGFDGITDIGRSIEVAAKEANSEEIKKWINELTDYLERVEIIYE